MFHAAPLWKFLANAWAFVYVIFLAVNFVSKNGLDYLVSPLSALYVGILALYVGDKEFDRWRESHRGRRRGEYFVIGFTVVIFALFLGAWLLGEAYRVPSEVVATYIAVMTIFAITEKSKRLHAHRG